MAMEKLKPLPLLFLILSPITLHARNGFFLKSFIALSKPLSSIFLPNATSIFIETGKLNSIDIIAQELQKALEKNFNLFKINENELIKNYNSLLYKKNEISNFSANDMSKFQGKIIKVGIDGKITIRVSNKQLSKYSESEIKLII